MAIKNDDRDSLLVYEVVIPLRNLLGPKWMAKAAKNRFSINLALNSTPGTGGGYRGGRPGGGVIGIRGPGGMRGTGGGRRYGGGGAPTQDKRKKTAGTAAGCRWCRVPADKIAVPYIQNARNFVYYSSSLLQR
ncbi:hypothetical protein ACQ86N_13990 [Puia sp. P3]|uniref:hypothetical protein n=1 Tax=Puia sp. P3 TaxID=3423952 RepID=UPI003D66B9D2